MATVVQTFIFVVVITFFLSLIPNQSNFSSWIMIPLLTAFFTKYTLGDWDSGYQYTILDIVYWIFLFGVSYITLQYT